MTDDISSHSEIMALLAAELDNYNVSPETQALLLQNAHIARYVPDDIIISQGGEARHLMFIAKGHARITIQNSAGQERMLAFSGTRSWLLLLPCLDNLRIPYTAWAVSNTTVITIPKAAVLQANTSDMGFKELVITLLGQRLRLSFNRLSSIQLKSTKQRLAEAIDEFYAEQPHHAPGTSRDKTLRITKTELASALGLSRTHITRAMQELEAEGYIENRYGRIRIIDIRQLRELAYAGDINY